MQKYTDFRCLENIPDFHLSSDKYGAALTSGENGVAVAHSPLSRISGNWNEDLEMAWRDSIRRELEELFYEYDGDVATLLVWDPVFIDDGIKYQLLRGGSGIEIVSVGIITPMVFSIIQETLGVEDFYPPARYR
jgi:hypothetical protein